MNPNQRQVFARVIEELSRLNLESEAIEVLSEVAKTYDIIVTEEGKR